MFTFKAFCLFFEFIRSFWKFVLLILKKVIRLYPLRYMGL